MHFHCNGNEKEGEKKKQYSFKKKNIIPLLYKQLKINIYIYIMKQTQYNERY